MNVAIIDPESRRGEGDDVVWERNDKPAGQKIHGPPSQNTCIVKSENESRELISSANVSLVNRSSYELLELHNFGEALPAKLPYTWNDFGVAFIESDFL